MKIHQEFVLQLPLSDLWDFFHDVPAVASCLPGAEYLGEKEGGVYLGRMSSKVGPFQAKFDGEATVTYHDATSAIGLEAKGIDKKGGSRGKMTMDCQLAPAGDGTKIAVDADVQLSGAIAQFGRTGIIQEIATVLVQDFVRNVEARFAAKNAAVQSGGAAAAPPPVAAAAPISGTRLLVLSLKAWLGKLFGKTAS
jgi:uncharacterized protein